MIPFPLGATVARLLTPPMVAAILIAVGGLACLGGALVLRDMVQDRVAAAVVARDAYWRAQIAAANALHEAARAAQARQALAAEVEAQAAQASILDQLRTLEARNAALPQSGRCGVDRARVRLLQNH